MSNFKSGSGNLDFGGDEEDDGEDDDTDHSPSQTAESADDSAQGSTESSPGEPDEPSSTTAETDVDQPSSDQIDGTETSATSTSHDYPYFVRRSNVGDERDTRLEIHVREKVANQEGEFRSRLAEQLDTNEVSKTDAREFALLAAFEHPERVAELMVDEGFGALD